MPGEVLEFMADRLTVPPVFVAGNHANELVPDEYDPEGLGRKDPGGCLNAHARVINLQGLLIVGFEGSLRYRDGPYQYTQRQFARMAGALTPRLLWNRQRYGRAVDILLTHAPPTGPNAGPDRPHHGIAAFEKFSRRWRPKVHVHGHVHLLGANAGREYRTEEGVRVINAYEFTLIDL